MIVDRVRVSEGPIPREWPFDLAPVKELVRDGLSLTADITFLVGENGSGKSTIVEAIAEAYGADVRGGHTGRRYDNRPPKGPLGSHLLLDYTPISGAKRRRPQGYFLRAETAYGVFEFMSEHHVDGYGPDHLLQVSHGESFLQVFRAQFNKPGLYLLDEPEAALSFSSCLALMRVLREVVDAGGQVICATHSPVLSALPGAQIIELTQSGLKPVEWADLEVVQHWATYLTDPNIYLRHLFD